MEYLSANKKIKQGEWCVGIVIILTFLKGWFDNVPVIGSYLNSTFDVCILLLIYYLHLNAKTHESWMKNKSIKMMLMFVVCFFCYSVLTYVVNYQSIFYFIMGIRNTFSYYIVFFATAVYVRREHIPYVFNVLNGIFYIHAFMAFVEYYCVGYMQDYLGGIFGVRQGCNGYLNIFNLIILAITIVMYINKAVGIWPTLLKVALLLYIAALSELKFFFVEFAVVIIIAVLISGFTWRKLIVIVVSIIGMFFGIKIFLQIFPGWSNFFTNKTSYIDVARSAEGYTGSGDMNRLNFIQQANDVLSESWRKIVGFGVGNCETSSISFFNTSFADKYQYLHYSWLSTATTYLELGSIGLIFLFGFFVTLIFAFVKIKKRHNDIVVQIGIILAVISLLILVYNSSLKSEAAYFMYFMLALPFTKWQYKSCENIKDYAGTIIKKKQILIKDGVVSFKCSR